MKMRKYYRGLCGALAGCLIAAAPPLSVRAEEAGYIRAATYTSDAWVSNFWNTESDHMEEELAQIAADGFNTIILVIPWREFQPSGYGGSRKTGAFCYVSSWLYLGLLWG